MTIYNKGILSRRTAKVIIVIATMLILNSFSALSQESRRSRRASRSKTPVELPADTSANVQISDSLRFVQDSTFRADSSASADSVALLKNSSLEAPAFTTARDSIIEDFSDGKKMIYYYLMLMIKL